MIPAKNFDGSGRTRGMDPVNHCKRWSPEDQQTLETMVAARASNRAIGEALGRTTATIANRRHQRGLVYRLTKCPVCGGPIQQAAVGRPRSICGPNCEQVVRGEQALAQRIRQALETRTDWRCAAIGCRRILVPPDPRKYCSRECTRRAAEDAYREDGRRAAAGRRGNERRARERLAAAPVTGEVVAIETKSLDTNSPSPSEV